MNLKFLAKIEKNFAGNEGESLIHFTNKFLKKITENLNNFSYNIIIANMHEMYSFMMKELDQPYKSLTLIENYKKILVSISPVIPHFANECLNMIDKNKDISWPSYDDNLAEEKELTIVIQINGKKRGLIKVGRNIEEKNIYELIMKDEKISKYINEKNIKKKIYVKNKLVNLIV